MKKVIIMSAVVLLSACSTFNKSENNVPMAATEPLVNQKLNTNFTRQGVKLEWECDRSLKTPIKCEKTDISSIEVTGYAPSYGSSENARERAFVVAEMQAKSKLAHFLNEEIKSSRVVNTLTRNLENANDRIKVNLQVEQNLHFSDADFGLNNKPKLNNDSNDNTGTRENINNTVRTVTETITSNAQIIMRGVASVKEEVVDRQTVAVTIRWSKDYDKAVGLIRSRFQFN